MAAMTGPAPFPVGDRRHHGGLRTTRVLCAECDTPSVYPAYICGACGGPLVVEAKPLTVADLDPDPEAGGVWRHRAMLPRTGHAVTLGEGQTPLVDVSSALGAAGIDQKVYAKLESLNPTLSFKDRAMALAASLARDLGLDGLVLASTGNAALSAAAYAAAAGLRCRIVCGTGSQAAQKLSMAATHGAEIEVIDGDYSTAYRTAAGQEEARWLNVTTTYRNPMLAEAYRGLAVELVEQMGTRPDLVLVPVGAGPLLFGLHRGFRDMQTVGAIDRSPRLVGVQAAACAPLARAWDDGSWYRSLMEPITASTTRAGAIADPLRGYEREGLLTLDAARESGGAITAVSEEALGAAVGELARLGLHVEPAAAAGLAALRDPKVEDLARQASAVSGSSAAVALIVTGHGAKEPVLT